MAIIATPSIVSVIIGTNKIVETEVNSAINESLSYYQENYFQDFELIEETFEIGMEMYQSGRTVNNLNHHLADGMVKAISAEYGLGFLGQYLLRNSKKEMIEQLEGIEKAFLFLIVSKGLEQLDLDGTIGEDQLDKAFYTWLHSNGENDYDNINSWLSHQVSSVTRPFTFSLYLPFLIVSLVIVLINVLEVIYFFKFSAHARLKV